MGMLGTLAKVAIGYAAARGVQHVSQNGGLGGLLGGASVPSGQAEAGQNPAMAGLQGMPGMEQLQSMMQGGGGNLQEMLGGLMGGAGGGAGGLQDMLGSLMGGGSAQQGDGGAGGLLSGAGGGAGLAGILAMAGSAAAASGGGLGGLFDAMNTKETAPQAEEAAGLMLRAMIQAAKADGDIDAQEQEKILGLLGDDADAEDMAFVRAQLAAPVDIAGLANDTPAPQRMQVYSMSLMAIRLDTQAEAAYLDQLAGAMGLDQQTVNALHTQMGVQPLYS
ncbi:DUF533 domain-containing protein [Primorskyibacter sp. S187A]|uniref:DUF533 domain-containing protein n=1 Tax=Primorskyibacter sp. S187A TaxID=3415130 RepID=UPI003C7B415F